jgi:hypothetical protein
VGEAYGILADSPVRIIWNRNVEKKFAENL